MPALFSKQALRARYREIEAAEAEIAARVAPFRVEQDRLAAIEGRLREEVRANNAALRQARGDLFDLENEKAMIARALGQRGLIDETAAATETVTVTASDVGAMPDAVTAG